MCFSNFLSSFCWEKTLAKLALAFSSFGANRACCFNLDNQLHGHTLIFKLPEAFNIWFCWKYSSTICFENKITFFPFGNPRWCQTYACFPNNNCLKERKLFLMFLPKTTFCGLKKFDSKQFTQLREEGFTFGKDLYFMSCSYFPPF